MPPREKKPRHSQKEMLEVAGHLNRALDQLEDMHPSDPRRGRVSFVASLIALEVDSDLQERGIDMGTKRTRKAKDNS